MRKLDIAQLYLRIIIGGMLILHNIYKMQNYNEVISSYPAIDELSGRFWHVAFATVESVTAIMLIIGWRVRLAASTLIIGTILAMLIYFPSPSAEDFELKAIYTFIYIYVLITGGGLYSLDSVQNRHKPT